MSKVLAKKPSRKQTFIQNYLDHLHFVDQKINMKAGRLLDVEPHKMLAAFSSEPCFFSFNAFDAYRDGHDFCDEVAGVTVIPLVLFCTTFSMLGYAIAGAAIEFAINMNWIIKDYRIDVIQPVQALYLSGTLLLAAAMSLIKSGISIVTRPLATIIHGYQPQDENRFFGERTGDEMFIEGLETITNEAISFLNNH